MDTNKKNNFFDIVDFSVGDGLINKADDVIRIKRILFLLGYLCPDKNLLNGYITKYMDKAIKDLQKDRNLKIDGKIFPKKETDKTICNIISKIIQDIESVN